MIIIVLPLHIPWKHHEEVPVELDKLSIQLTYYLWIKSLLYYILPKLIPFLVTFAASHCQEHKRKQYNSVKGNNI